MIRDVLRAMRVAEREMRRKRPEGTPPPVVRVDDPWAVAERVRWMCDLLLRTDRYRVPVNLDGERVYFVGIGTGCWVGVADSHRVSPSLYDQTLVDLKARR